MSDNTTPERILAAAEALFAERGVGSVSLRSIVAKADVNIAAIHYHFGSKEKLVREMFRRRLSQINDERLRLLENERERFRAEPCLPISEILRAFLKPAIAMGVDQERGGKNFFRVAARAHSEPDPAVREVFFEELSEVIEQFLLEFRRALPALTEQERLMRLAFVAGSMVQAILFPFKEMMEMREVPSAIKAEELLESLICFCAGGMAASLPQRGAE